MKLKKIVVSGMIFGLLMGGTITCYAAHIHNYHVNFGKSYCYSSMTGTSHQYISGWETNPVTGKKTPIYSTCQTVIYRYSAPYECIECNAPSGNEYLYSKEVHQNCGQ